MSTHKRAKPPQHVKEAVNLPGKLEERDGKLWFFFGSGSINEQLTRSFVEMFPGSERDWDIDEAWWVWEPTMAAEEYAHFGIKVSVEWFRRE